MAKARQGKVSGKPKFNQRNENFVGLSPKFDTIQYYLINEHIRVAFSPYSSFFLLLQQPQNVRRNADGPCASQNIHSFSFNKINTFILFKWSLYTFLSVPVTSAACSHYLFYLNIFLYFKFQYIIPSFIKQSLSW